MTIHDPRPGDRFYAVRDTYTFLATRASTAGACMVLDAVIPPGGGPPPHMHTREHETFVVLDGTITAFEDGTERELGPGQSVCLAPHKVHTFTNRTDRPARMLVICVPGDIERMFAEGGTPLAPGQTPPAPTAADFARLAGACERAGIRLMIPG